MIKTKKHNQQQVVLDYTEDLLYGVKTRGSNTYLSKYELDVRESLFCE